MSAQPANCVRCGKTRKWYRSRFEGGCGLCGTCYHAARRARGGAPLGEPRQPVPETCRDCGMPTDHNSAKGRCGRCYRRWDRAGRPAGPVPVRVALRSGWYGYSPATGTARLEEAS